MKKLSYYMNKDSHYDDVARNFTFLNTLDRKFALPKEGMSVIISNLISGGFEFFLTLMLDVL
jgi:hypothetical protein